MKHRIIALAVALGLAATAVVSAPAASAAPGDWDMILTQDPPVLVDNIVIDGVLIERTFEAVVRDQSGRKVGRIFGSHRDIDAIERPKLDVRYRTLVFDFPDGQIIAEGISKYPSAGPFIRPGTKTLIAITGGTGAYAGVKGELKTVYLGKGQHRQMLRFVN